MVYGSEGAMTGDFGNDAEVSGGGDAGAKYFHDDLMAEYNRLADTVAAFDQRLLTVKSWGVTFSLATLALGFQQDHYGLFLVAAAGALGFWLIEVSTKTHQMRHYPRMGDIEAIAHDLYGVRTDHGVVSAPLIDWSWHTASERIWGASNGSWASRVLSARPKALGRRRRAPAVAAPVPPDPQVPQRWPAVNTNPGVNHRILLWPHVALPHVITVVLGTVLFLLGWNGKFGPI